MTHPDLARELGVLLPCTECMHTRSSGHWCEDGGRFRGDEYCDNCTVRPAILALIRTLLREEREKVECQRDLVECALAYIQANQRETPDEEEIGDCYTHLYFAAIDMATKQAEPIMQTRGPKP